MSCPLRFPYRPTFMQRDVSSLVYRFLSCNSFYLYASSHEQKYVRRLQTSATHLPAMYLLMDAFSMLMHIAQLHVVRDGASATFSDVLHTSQYSVFNDHRPLDPAAFFSLSVPTSTNMRYR